MARIVIVDDNPAARHFAGAALQQAGHTVEEVAPECLYHILKLLHEQKPDLLISDLIMPECPGQTLIRACREDVHLQDLKILLLSAHGDVRLPHFLQEMGNTHYLTKPVAPAALAECVDLFLKGELALSTGGAPSARGMVAVVDDSRLTRAYVSTCLRRAGFGTLEIDPHTMFSVMNQLREQRPVMLVLDYLMPGFQGDALIRAIRAQEDPDLRDLPVLMVTAHSSVDLENLLAPLQGVEVLLKPIQEADLVRGVEGMLGLAHTPR